MSEQLINFARSTITFLSTTRGLILTGAILAITPLQIVAFLITIVVAVRLLPFEFLGIITRLLLAFGLSMCVVTFIAIAAWAIHVPLNAPIILLLLLAMLGVWWWVRTKRNVPEIRRWKTDRYELAAAVVSVASMLFIAAPVLQDSNAAAVLRIISAGGDNSSHIDMMKADDLNQGIAYGYNNRVNPPLSSVNYPQGWHFNLAFYKWATDPLLHYQNRAGKILLLFYSISVLWFGLLVFFIARLGLRLAEFLPGKKHPLALLGAVAVVGGVTIHWLLQLFTHGFQAQSASLTLLVMEALVLAEAFNKPAAKRWPLIIVATTLAVGCNFVWVFIMPITCGAVAAAAITTAISLKKLPAWPIVLTFVVLALLALVQPLFYLIYPVTFEFPIILQRGDINATSMMALLTITAILLGYLIMRWKVRPLRIVMVIAGAGLVFAFGLMLYQLHELHELRYFYYKSTYTFIVIAAAVLAMLAFELVARLADAVKPKLFVTCLLTLLILATTGLSWWQIQDPNARMYVDGTLGGMSGPEALALIDQVAKGPETSSSTVFIGACNRADDIRASLFVAALTFSTIRHNSSFDPGAHDEHVVFGTIRNAMIEPGRHITVVTSDQVVLAHLKQYLGDEYKNITVINLDLTPETEPITQCPDRIRDLSLFPET